MVLDTFSTKTSPLFAHMESGAFLSWMPAGLGQGTRVQTGPAQNLAQEKTDPWLVPVLLPFPLKQDKWHFIWGVTSVLPPTALMSVHSFSDMMPEGTWRKRTSPKHSLEICLFVIYFHRFRRWHPFHFLYCVHGFHSGNALCDGCSWFWDAW